MLLRVDPSEARVNGRRYGSKLTASAETQSHMLKATRWAGNVGELAKQRTPISSPLIPAFTPLPYYRVYRSTFTPLGPPTPGTRSRHRDAG